MSRHFQHKSDESYGGGWDYEGLQVDTRAQDNTDKHLDPLKPHIPKPKRESNDVYLHEKEIRVEEASADSPTSIESPIDSTLTSAMAGTTVVPETPITPAKLKSMEDEGPQPPKPEPRRICGLRRRHFWVLFLLVLALVIVAAVVGGVVGGTKRSSSTPPEASTSASASPAASATPSVVPTFSGPLRGRDVIVDSPLNVISYAKPGNGDPSSQQVFRMYYQSAIGNIKETVSDALGPWKVATPIFTDAINNTGLATITYMGATELQASMYYVDTEQNLQEKRKNITNSDPEDIWEQWTLHSQLQLQVTGNRSLPDTDNDDPVNEWDGYRIAAVYSTSFFGGPQARVFFHTQTMKGASIIQELIWNQNADKWTKGTNFTTAYPTSHMAATIDESTNILRLFFSTGNKTLQEYWTDVTSIDTNYAKGLSFPNFLTHNNADISALSLNGTTYIYHSTPDSNNSIHETQISGIPGSANNQETFNSTSTLVVKPSNASAQGEAIYQPFAAAKTNTTGLDTSLYVFWANNLVGAKGAKVEGGYSQINQMERPATDDAWPEQQGDSVEQIPLGMENAQPSP